MGIGLFIDGYRFVQIIPDCGVDTYILDQIRTEIVYSAGRRAKMLVVQHGHDKYSNAGISFFRSSFLTVSLIPIYWIR